MLWLNLAGKDKNNQSKLCKIEKFMDSFLSMYKLLLRAGKDVWVDESLVPLRELRLLEPTAPKNTRLAKCLLTLKIIIYFKVCRDPKKIIFIRVKYP